jgi:hypothetical protein
MRQAIQITLDTGPQTVDADVFGQWAAHESIHDLRIGSKRPQYVITHVPTGLRCPCVELWSISKRQAVSVARHLGETVTATLVECAEILADARNETVGDASKAFAVRVVHAVREWTRKEAA